MLTALSRAKPRCSFEPDEMIVAPISGLDAFQRDFAAALAGDAAESVEPADTNVRALLAHPGFAVYRNTVATAGIDALAANFPTVLQIVGGTWFNDAALRFMRGSPCNDGRLAAYGASFPGFLASFAPAVDLPYLHAVALLDRLWTESHLAADQTALDIDALACLAPAELADAVLSPHPAARWASFPEMPAFTIWRRHREHLDVAADLEWHGEGALLTRPEGVVTWHAVTNAEVAFLDACARRAGFAAAAAAAGDAERVAQALPRLISVGAFARCNR
ncbi:MAG: DNA-binding domain-containing protein [Pseudomonadota bacterium]|nr:DNA-binding domain-containing protein [Pseudomonadota bacterium]